MPDVILQRRGLDVQVFEAITAWRQKFEAGELQLRGRRQPKLDPGERLAVRIFSVGAMERDLRQHPSEWEPRPGSPAFWKFWSGKSMGTAVATSQRLLILNRQSRESDWCTVREWHWDDLYAVSVIPGWTGVALRPSADAVTGDVVASEWNRWSIPDLRKTIINWVAVEGAFAASRGKMDAWLERLPRRLA